MRRDLLAIALAVVATHSIAQPKQQGSGVSAALQSQAAAASAPVLPPPPVKAGAPIVPVVQTEQQAIRDQLSGIVAGIAKLESRPSTPWWATAVTALGAALVGGLASALVAFGTQRRLLKHQSAQAEVRAKVEDSLLDKKGSFDEMLAKRKASFDEELASRKANFDESLAEKKARTEAEQTRFKWRIQQLTELYGPLCTLLGQSNHVYRLMNEVLCAQDSSRFRFRPSPSNSDPDGKLFEILDSSSGEWRRFRSIIDWDQVYGSNLGVDAYLDEVVEIGSRISVIVTEKAGLVLVHHGELLDTFSQYLAHFRVLRQLHAQSRDSAKDQPAPGAVTPLVVRESAAFPIKIQSLAKAGLAELLGELAKSSIQGMTSQA